MPKLIAYMFAFVVLLVGAHQFFLIYDDRSARTGAYRLLNEAEPFKTEVEKALQGGSPMPVAKNLPRQARSMKAGSDGTIVIEVTDDLFPNGRLFLRPASNAKGEVMWTCRAENVRGALLPAWCRG